MKSALFQFHKGTIRTRWILGVDARRIYGFASAKIQKIFRKMSMPKDIFSAVLRQPAYLWRFQ